MKIALFGATGRVGSEVLKLALADGHEVTVLVRSAEKLPVHDLLTVIEGDVRLGEDVLKVIKGADVVFSALGSGKTTILSEATPHFISEMDASGVKRIVTIGTAGILQSRNYPEQLRYETPESNRAFTLPAEEHHRAYDVLKASDLDWTIVCPTYLPDGDAVGNYRILRDYVPEDSKRITVGDVAAFAYGELLEKKHIAHRVGIAY